MSGIDYLPKNDLMLLQWVTNFLNYISVTLARYGFPLEVYEKLEALRNTFKTKLDTAETPASHTKMSIQAKNTAKKALTTALRQAVKEYLTYNHLVTDEDRDALGLPIHKTTRTPIPPPTDLVELMLKQLAGNRVEVNFFPMGVNDTGKERREAKPFGVRGAEIRWAMLSEPPKSHDDLVHSEFDTRSPYMFQFDLPDAGKTLYVCARWENTTGQKGPWNKIESVIVP
jgi:hypothetical protein